MFKVIIIGLVVTVVGLFVMSKIDPNNQSTVNQTSVTSYYSGDDAVNVTIEGQILHPGKYDVSPQYTLANLIDMAGGVLEDSDPNAYTPSLYIGSRTLFYIPKKNKLSEMCYQEEIEKVNINTATASTISSKTEMSSTQATALVTYREENGSFQAIEDILKVKGIGEGTYAKVRDYICLS
jgi:competence protein ComEA